jgi:hypothetical protein
LANKFTKIFHTKAFKIDQNRHFWYDNKRSGNPGCRVSFDLLMAKKEMFSHFFHLEIEAAEKFFSFEKSPKI